jgi:hypothetical protein
VKPSIDDIITRIDEGKITVATPALDRCLAGIERIARRAAATAIFAGLCARRGPRG